MDQYTQKEKENLLQKHLGIGQGKNYQELILIPKDLKLEFKQEIPWYQNPSSYSPVITFVAIFIGYFLSKLSEERTWKRKKAEQIRERQVTCLSSLLSTLQSIMETNSNLLNEYNVIINQAQHEGEAIRNAVYSDFKNKLTDISSLLGAEIRDLQIESVKLRLLKISKPIDNIIIECVSKNVEIRNKVDDLKTNVNSIQHPDNYNCLEDIIKTLVTKIDMLTQSALEGLHE
jgi:isoleucyl-tRNA synthetase